MFNFAIPAVAALGLIAWAAQTHATPEQPREPGLGWHVSHEGDMAKLAYGVENSDQLALMMTCEPGQATAVVYGDVAPAGARLQSTAGGPAAIDPLSGDLTEESQLSLRDPAVQALVHNGRMPVVGEAGRSELTATRDERRLIGEFIAYCGSDRA